MPVLDTQRIGKREHVFLEAVVVSILHRRRDDARRRRGHERLRERHSRFCQHALEVGAFALEWLAILVANLAHRHRRVHQIDHLPISEPHLLQIRWVLHDIAHQLPLAAPAEPAHPVMVVGEETLAWLLAVVADIDTRLELLCYDPAGRLLDLALEFRGVDLLAAVSSHKQVLEPGGAGQAAGVGGQDTLFAAQHCVALRRLTVRWAERIAPGCRCNRADNPEAAAAADTRTAAAYIGPAGDSRL